MNKIKLGFIGLFCFASILMVSGQSDDTAPVGGQSRASMAVDATAAQWSYQFAFEKFFDYKDDLVDGVMRPPGQKSFFQYRMVAPIPKGALPFTVLPRLTLRMIENAEGNWGFGGSDLFALIIAQEWATGRWGIGPQINFPSQEGFGSTDWGFGASAAVTQRAFSDKLFIALLFQQAWTSGVANSLVINPTLVFQLGDGWYVGNGDFVMRYSWDTKKWLIPWGVRFGKAFINEKRTINTYVEFAGPAVYKEWRGSVPTQTFRFNFQWQIPVNFGN